MIPFQEVWRWLLEKKSVQLKNRNRNYLEENNFESVRKERSKIFLTFLKLLLANIIWYEVKFVGTFITILLIRFNLSDVFNFAASQCFSFVIHQTLLLLFLFTSIHFPLSIQPRDMNFLSFFVPLWTNSLYIFLRSIRNLQLPVCCFHSRETRFPPRLLITEAHRLNIGIFGKISQFERTVESKRIQFRI